MSCFFGFIPISWDDSRSFNCQFPHFSRRKLLLRIAEIHDLSIMAWNGNPNGNRSCRWIYRCSRSQGDKSRRGSTFREAVNVVNVSPCQLFESLYDSGNHWGSSTVNFSEGGKIHLSDFGVIHQGNEDGNGSDGSGCLPS